MSQVLLDILIKGTDQSRGALLGLRQNLREAQKDTSGLNGHLDKLNKTLGGVNAQADATRDRWKNLTDAAHGAGLGMTIMGGAIVAGFAMAIEKTAEFGAEIHDVALQTGLATETVSRLGYIAQATGQDMRGLALSAIFLLKNAGDAPAKFTAIGVSVRDANGHMKTADALFWQTLEALRQIPDQGQRTAAAIDLMGRGGRAMLPILNMSNEAFAELQKTAGNVAWSKEQADGAKRYEEAMMSLKATLGKAMMEGTAPLMKDAEEMIPKIAELVHEVGAFAGEHPGLVKMVLEFGLLNAALGPVLMSAGRLVTAGQMAGAAWKWMAGLGAAKGAAVVATDAEMGITLYASTAGKSIAATFIGTVAGAGAAVIGAALAGAIITGLEANAIGGASAAAMRDAKTPGDAAKIGGLGLLKSLMMGGPILGAAAGAKALWDMITGKGKSGGAASTGTITPEMMVGGIFGNAAAIAAAGTGPGGADAATSSPGGADAATSSLGDAATASLAPVKALADSLREMAAAADKAALAQKDKAEADKLSYLETQVGIARFYGGQYSQSAGLALSQEHYRYSRELALRGDVVGSSREQLAGLQAGQAAGVVRIEMAPGAEKFIAAHVVKSARGAALQPAG